MSRTPVPFEIHSLDKLTDPSLILAQALDARFPSPDGVFPELSDKEVADYEKIIEAVLGDAVKVTLLPEEQVDEAG